MELKEPIEDFNNLDLNQSYNYWDYLKFKFSERVELIMGRIRLMSPAPNANHQRVVKNTTMAFETRMRGMVCEFFVSPFDVRLPVPNTEKDSTVVQPDFCVVCDPHKIDGQACIGAPDLVAEILSAGNSKHELATKFNLYESSGVKEYWILQPIDKTIFIYHLVNNKFQGLHPFTEGMMIESPTFPDLKIEVDELFYNLK